jgi:hypothetical protein
MPAGGFAELPRKHRICLKTAKTGIDIAVLRLVLVIELLLAVLQFLDLALQLLHLRLHCCIWLTMPMPRLVLVLRLLFELRDPIGTDSDANPAHVTGRHKQHGGRNRARHADSDREAVSQLHTSYSAV